MPTIDAAAKEMEVKDVAVETKTTKKGGAKMETAKTVKKAAPKVDYKNHKEFGKVMVDMALAKGVKVAWDYGKATLKLGNTAPWDNPFHAMKNTSKDNKEQLLKVVAILAIKKDNPSGNKHVLDQTMGKIKANIEGLKNEKDILAAAKKYVK